MTRAQDVDAAWVAERRAARVSWFAIARMAGCNEVDLRRHHEAGFTGDTPRQAASPRQKVEAAMRAAGLTADQARVIGRLWHANGARITAQDLCRGMIGGAGASVLASEAKAEAQRRCRIRFEVRAARTGFALTPEGVLRVSALAGLRGRP